MTMKNRNRRCVADGAMIGVHSWMTVSLLVVIGASLSLQTTEAFTATSTPACAATIGRRSVHNKNQATIPLSQWKFLHLHNQKYDGVVRRSSFQTELYMYNLPPSGGGGGGDSGLADIAKGVLALVLVIGFFASPLGGLVLGLFNSLLLLSILTPIILGIGFQAWQYFNTIEAPCPSCSTPIKAFKTNTETGEAVPTVCYNCGAILQANYDNTAIDNISGRKSVVDDDDFASSMNSIFDIFGGREGSSDSPGMTTTTTTTTVIEEKTKQDQRSRQKREQTVIDVEIEDDSTKPWQ